MHERCAGLDVPNKTVVACVLPPEGQEIRPVGLLTAELRALAEGLLASGCPPVALESTGAYGKPGFNLLEGALEVFWVNAPPSRLALDARRRAKRPRGWPTSGRLARGAPA